MSTPVKEKITTNLDRAKGEGKLRAENIREIVKDAVSQTVAELKEGTGEIRSIVKDAIAAVVGDLKGNETEDHERITASIEGAIAGSTDQRQQEIAQRRIRLSAIQSQLDEQQEQLDRETSEMMTDIKSLSMTAPHDNNSEVINLAVSNVQERQEVGVLQEQYFNLRDQLASLDKKLAVRYGDRYSEIKQQWEKAKTWYDQKKTEAETSGTIPMQQKQAELECNVGDFGAVVARKEKEITQNLQDLWQDKVSGTKR
jgi:hypothetical protein